MDCRNHIFVLILLAFLLLSPPTYSQDDRGLNLSGQGKWGNYHALIIGINAYKEWTRLQTAVNDATALKKILIKRYGFDEKNVILRIDDSASRLLLLQDIRYIASKLGKQDNLLIYFAGHGQLDDLTGDGYWIPIEGSLKDPATWISHSMLKNILSSERIKGKNILVIADSCYSGGLLRGGPGLLSLSDQGYRQKLASLASLRSRQVITSGGLEPVADGGRDGHSLFAYYLLKALEENQRDIIDIENLIHSSVWKPVAEIGGQRPSIGRLKSPMDEDGQFVLVSSITQVPKSAEERTKSHTGSSITFSNNKTRTYNNQFEILFWESIKDANNIQMYEDYLKKFPNGTFAELARINIKNLSKTDANRKQTLKIQKQKELELQRQKELELQKQRELALQRQKELELQKQKELELQKQKELALQRQKELELQKQKDLDRKKKQMQASISPAPTKVKPSVPSKVEVDKLEYRIKLAIFPWRLTGTASRWNLIAVYGLNNALRSYQQEIAPLYSYYDLKIEPKPQRLTEEMISENLVKQLWSGSGGQAPNVELVCQYGKNLGVDAVFMSNNYAKPWDPDPGTFKVFLIDTRTAQMYTARAVTQDYEGKGEQQFERLTENIIAEYMHHHKADIARDQREVADLSEKKVQASLSPLLSKPKVQKPDSRIKLAIFPWKLTGTASRWNLIAVYGLANALRSYQQEIAPLYSYYDLKIKPQPQRLTKEMISENLVKQLWSGSGGEAPNVDLVCQYGKNLGVDAVFMSNNYAKPWDPDPGTFKVFLIDTRTAQMYTANYSTQDYEGKGEHQFEQLSEKVFHAYIQNQ